MSAGPSWQLAKDNFARELPLVLEELKKHDFGSKRNGAKLHLIVRVILTIIFFGQLRETATRHKGEQENNLPKRNAWHVAGLLFHEKWVKAPDAVTLY